MRVKKLISSILVVMLLATVITVNAASFKDVKSSDWYYSSVNYVADQGIMNGTSSTKFSPKASLTRAMGVTLLYRVAGSPSVSGITLPFTDVKSGQWYTNAVKWAYKNGIVTGKSNTYFDTNGNITRAEFATILNRYSDFMKYTLPSTRSDFVTDVAAIPSWAFAAVTVMYKAEIINGRNGGVFDPNAKISRAEAAAMIERFMKAPKDGSSNGGNANPETQPPVEDPDIPTTGKLVVKEKKYDYNGANVMILNVENQTSKNLNVTFKATFYDASGKAIMKQNRMIEGFPANYRNYVVFEPGLKFDKFTYDVETETYTDETFVQHLSMKLLDVYANGNLLDIGDNKNRIRASVFMDTMFYYNSKTVIDITSDIVLFDTAGNIFLIHKYNARFGKFKESSELLMHEYDISIDDFNLPNNVNKNSPIILAIKTVKKT